MALLFYEGFEGTNTINHFLNRGWSTMTNLSIGTAGGRTGARYLSSTSTTSTAQWDAATADRNTVMTVGVAHQRVNNVNAGFTLTLVDTAAVNIAQVRLQNNGTTLELLVRGTVVATANLTDIGWIAVGGWNYVELRCFANATTGTAEVRVNGASAAVLTFTGNTSANLLSRVVLAPTIGSGSGAQSWIDDLYVTNGAGAVATSWLGDVRIETRSVNAAGAVTQFTPSTGANWQNVDEVPPSGGTDVNSSSTVGHVDTYACSALPGTVATALGVKALGFVRKSDAGTRTGALLLRIGGVNYKAAAFTPSTSYAYTMALWALNPATGAAWTVAAANALEPGISVES
jgi:hypothetical protein